MNRRQLLALVPATVLVSLERSVFAKDVELGLKDLDNETISLSSYSLEQAASLGLPGSSAAESSSRRIFAYEYLKYRDLEDGQRRGVAAQIFLDVRSFKASAQFSTLPIIAASATMGYAEIKASFRVRGMTSKTVTETLPKLKDLGFNVETYQGWMDALNAVRGEVWKEETTVRPVRLVQPRTQAEGDSYAAVVATTYALTKIADRESLNDALKKIPEDKPAVTKDIVLRVYRDFTGLGEADLDTEPSKVDQLRAQRYVDGLCEDA